MLIVTSDCEVIKVRGALTGYAVIAFIAEPDDDIGNLAHFTHAVIPSRIQPSASKQQIKSALNSLNKYLFHDGKIQPTSKIV